MSLDSMIRRAEQDIGLGEPNYIQEWYAERNGSAYSYNFAWCAAAITRWAYDAGEHHAVCFGTDYAYTVAHAQRFTQAGRWSSGTGGIRRGDIVFFDWGGSNGIAYIDHVGIVTGVSGGTVYTVEGNTSNQCLRRTRGAGVIAGYGRPAYGRGGEGGEMISDIIYGLEQGDTGPRVKVLQLALKRMGGEIAEALGTWGPNDDGVDEDYGDDTAEAARLARKMAGSRAKKGYGATMTQSAVEQIDWARTLAAIEQHGGGGTPEIPRDLDVRSLSARELHVGDA